MREIKREIKFRAWVKKDGRYIGNKMYSWETIIETINDECGFRKSLLHFGTDKDCSDYVILMQYTGLTDKNGKEIYEGDITTTEWEDKKEVVFWQGCFCHKRDDGMGHIFNPKKIEIIGNIWENPELIKK